MFIADDRFARDFYHELTGKRGLMDALEGRQLIAVEPGPGRSATVLSANGAAPARLTLARFHAPRTCGPAALVTELVLAFPPGGTVGRSAPPSHVTIVALLDAAPFAAGGGTTLRALPTLDAMALVRRVADRGELATRGPSAGLLHAPSLGADLAIDAGEVVPLRSQYAVGFRASFVRTVGESTTDTLLITGVAVTDPELRHLHWVVRPIRLRLVRGMIARATAGRLAPRDSRATAVDVNSRRIIAALPLALRCP